MSRAASIAAVVVIVAVAATLAVDAARRESACYDEPKHLATGVYAVAEHRFLGDDNGPLTALYGWQAAFRDLAVPAAPPANAATGKRVGLYDAGVRILIDNGLTKTLFLARLASVFWFVVLLVPTALLGARFGGRLGAVLATALAAFSPTLLAHASIVSADLPFAALCVVALLAWHRWTDAPSSARAATLGVVLGLAVAAKLTGVVAIAAVGLFFCARRGVPIRTRLGHAAVAAGALLVVLLIASAGDLGLFARQYELVSRYGRGVQNDYFRGAIGAGSLAFYPLVLALKLEPATLVALALAAVAVAAGARASRVDGRGDRKQPTAATAFAALVLVATMASGYRQGVRFLLPAFPLLAVAAAPLCRARAARFVAPALIVLQAATALAAHPHFLSYWNPIAGGARGGDRYFTDSNHDWGQDVTALAEWQREHADVRVFGALYSIVPPREYGVEFANLFDDPKSLAAFDAARPAAIVFSVTLLRALAVEARQPLHPIARALVDETPDFDCGGSIRGWRVTPERIAAITAAARER